MVLQSFRTGGRRRRNPDLASQAMADMSEPVVDNLVLAADKSVLAADNLDQAADSLVLVADKMELAVDCLQHCV